MLPAELLQYRAPVGRRNPFSTVVAPEGNICLSCIGSVHECDVLMLPFASLSLALSKGLREGTLAQRPDAARACLLQA